MFADTVTVYNRLGDIWYPAALRGVQVRLRRGSGPAAIGTGRKDELTVLVPFVPGPEGPWMGGRIWLPPKAWRAAEDPERYVTFDPGPGGTVILLGEREEAPAAEESWPEGFYAHVDRTEDGAFALTEAARYDALPHFELTGR